MQSVRFVMREIGGSQGAVSPQEFSEYIEYNFTSQGYKIWKQTELPISDAAKGFQGFRILLTLIKDDEVELPGVKPANNGEVLGTKKVVGLKGKKSA